MKNLKKILIALLVIAMLVPLALAAIPTVLAAEDAFSQWKTDGWTKKTEDGVQTVTCASGGIQRINLNGTTTGNVLTYEVRIGEVSSTVDANIGAIYTTTGGDMYFCEYNTVGRFTRLRRLGADGSDAHLGAAKELKLADGEWIQMEVIIQENYVRWSINGEKVYELSDTGKDVMTGGTIMLQGYNTACSLRNVKVESEEIEIVEKQHYDFEFTTADSVKSFTAEAGNVTWQNGKLIYTLTGASSTLTSPPISVEAGDPYAMLLPLRNTLLVRMKNNTSASQVRVSYTTIATPKYSEDKSAVFAVEPDSDYTTYFFNLTECQTVVGGYLYGFAIEPIGASSGSIEIEAVTFEREAAKYDWAGTVDSCTATADTVTVKGTLNSAYAGKTVKLYETNVENYTEVLLDSQVIGEVKADGTSFTIEVPMKNGNVDRLSSLFLVGVDGVKLSERFKIENYRDFSENPYAFDLPAYSVKVTDAQFGAKGDAFTNDTAAIQAAIDHVSGKGGGTVIVPGDDSTYGRRYMVTSLKLKDNVELHLEEGSILWQSPRAEEYDYEVALGHDVSIPGVNWTHAPVCHNYPLIWGDQAKNIKITGEGIIRTADTGSENIDSVGGSLWTGCPNRIHVMPIGLYRCENVEISGVELRRGNVWHAFNFGCKNVYYGDITMLEVTCASGDGISVGAGTENIVIDRCYLYSNDDAIVLFTSYNEPRGLVWWFPTPEADNSLRNVTVRNCNLLGGHGITFITWGTDNPDLSKQLITGINVYNNVLHGGGNSVGTWPDNPYYGKQPFDNFEKNDFSPVQNVRIFNNVYRNKCDLECIQGTDIVTDNAIRSATNFQYGNFERGDKKNPTWVVGLSNWTILETEGYKAGNVVAAGDKNNHYGLIKQAGGLAQGLWMNKGEHTFTIDTAVSSGEATLIVRDILTGETLAEQTVKASSDFTKQTLTFNLDKSTTAYIGVSYKGTGEVKLDNANVTSTTFKPQQYFTESFDDADAIQFTNSGFSIADGMAQVGGGTSGLMTLGSNFQYSEFDLHFRLRYDACLSEVDANFGLTFLGADINNGFNVNYNPLRHFIQTREVVGGATNQIDLRSGFDLPVGEWVDMAIRVQNGKCLWYMNGEKLAEFDVSGKGTITFIAYNINCALDEILLAKAGTTKITGDEVIVPEPPETDPPATEPPATEPPVTEPPVTDTPTDAPTDVPTAGPTDAPTDAPTGAPVSDPTATDTAPTATDKPAEGGCQSAVAGGTLALLAATGCALTLRRKRREE